MKSLQFSLNLSRNLVEYFGHVDSSKRIFRSWIWQWKQCYWRNVRWHKFLFFFTVLLVNILMEGTVTQNAKVVRTRTAGGFRCLSVVIPAYSTGESLVSPEGRWLAGKTHNLLVSTYVLACEAAQSAPRTPWFTADMQEVESETGIPSSLVHSIHKCDHTDRYEGCSAEVFSTWITCSACQHAVIYCREFHKWSWTL